MVFSLKEIIDLKKKRALKYTFYFTFLLIFYFTLVYIFFKKELFLGHIAFGFVLLIFVIHYICIYIKFNSVKEEELDISSEKIIFYSKDRYLITENYIFYLSDNFKRIKYEDIALIYKSKDLRWSINELVVVLYSGEKYYFEIGYIFMANENLFNFSHIIQEKNKDVLVGKVYENEKIMDEKYGINMYSFPLNIMIKIRKLIKKN